MNGVYLGSHIFKGLAREAALKLLELTDGRRDLRYDSPLGFRHGPKIDRQRETLVVIFLSNDPYTRRMTSTCWTRFSRDARRRRAGDLRPRGRAFGSESSAFWSPQCRMPRISTSCIPFIAAPQIFAFEQAIGRGLFRRINPTVRDRASGRAGRAHSRLRVTLIEPLCFLGVDGGGTKTHFVLVDATAIIASYEGPGSYHLEIGIEGLRQVLATVSPPCSRRPRLMASDVAYAFFGFRRMARTASPAAARWHAGGAARASR